MIDGTSRRLPMTRIGTLLFGTTILVALIFASPCRTFGQAEGYLRVASTPPGARVAIDGTVVGATGSEFESSPVISSTAGTHDLYVFLEGVGEDRFSITLFAADTLEIFIELGGTEQLLTLTSSPSEAQVTINGVEMGQTPIEGFRIMGADYQVSLTLECYLPYESQVSMAGKPQLNLHVDMRQTIVVQEPHPAELTQISLCQTGRSFLASYSLIPGPTTDGSTKWEVNAILRNPLGEITQAKMSGDVNRTMSIGAKSFDIELPQNAGLNDTFELHFSTVPKGGESSSKLPLIGGAALLIAGGVAAAVFLGGGDGSSGTQPPPPPGRPN